MSTTKYTPRLADKYTKEVIPALMMSLRAICRSWTDNGPAAKALTPLPLLDPVSKPSSTREICQSRLISMAN